MKLIKNLIAASLILTFASSIATAQSDEDISERREEIVQDFKQVCKKADALGSDAAQAADLDKVIRDVIQDVSNDKRMTEEDLDQLDMAAEEMEIVMNNIQKIDNDLRAFGNDTKTPPPSSGSTSTSRPTSGSKGTRDSDNVTRDNNNWDTDGKAPETTLTRQELAEKNELTDELQFQIQSMQDIVKKVGKAINN